MVALVKTLQGDVIFAKEKETNARFTKKKEGNLPSAGY